jgi:hypothetical protein
MWQRTYRPKYNYQPVSRLHIDFSCDNHPKRPFFGWRKRQPSVDTTFFYDNHSRYLIRTSRQQGLSKILTVAMITTLMGGWWYLNQPKTFDVLLAEGLSAIKSLNLPVFTRLLDNTSVTVSEHQNVNSQIKQEISISSPVEVERSSLLTQKNLSLPQKTETRLSSHPPSASQEKTTTLVLAQTQPVPVSRVQTKMSQTQPKKDHWLSVTVKSGDNLSGIFSQHKLSRGALYRMLRLGDAVRELTRLRPGQKIRIRHDPAGHVNALIKEIDFARELHILAESDSEHGYVSSF